MFHFVDRPHKPVQSRNGDLDVLRGFAIILVLVNHVSVAFIVPSAVLALLPIDGCSIGVAVFFAVSGYIITQTLTSDRGSTPDWRSFYIRRIFRIMPLALVWVEVTLIGTQLANAHGYFGEWQTNSRAAAWVIMLAANIGMNTEPGRLGALGVYWSLAVEEQFYVVAPLLMMMNRRLLGVAVTLLLVNAVAVINGPVAKDVFQFMPLLLGLMVGLVMPATRPQTRFASGSTASRPILWMILLGLPFAADATLTNYRYYCGIYAVCGLVVAAAALQRDLLARPAPLARVLRYVGTRSYGLYLSHFAVSMFLREAWKFALERGIVADGAMADTAMLVSWLVVTFGITEILHRKVEVPLIAYGRRASDAIRADGMPARLIRPVLVE